MDTLAPKGLRAWIYDRRTPLLYFCVAVVFSVIAGLHAYDVLVAGSRVPIMDYWKWIAVYGQKVLDGTVTLGDWFRSDAGQHIQPACMMLNFWMLKLFNFNVFPLVLGGLILRVLVALGGVVLFLSQYKKNEEHSPALLLLCVALLSFAFLNNNQWEMVTQPFSFTSIFRVAQYYISFYLADLLASRVTERGVRKNILFGALFGLYCAFLTIFFSAAYFVGHLTAIGVSLLLALYREREKWKQFILPYGAWFVLSFAAALVYYAVLSSRSDSFMQTVGFFKMLVLVMEGVCYYLGSALVHQTVTDYSGVGIVTLVGILLIEYIIFISICYLRLNKEGKKFFPLTCVIYSVLIGIVISLGRVASFGAITMTSSRYVVESTFAVFGAAWMTYEVFKGKKPSAGNSNWVVYLATAFCALWLLAGSILENNIAIYRKAYDNTLRDMMLNIEEYADDELGAFQANSPDDVRYCIEFFKENGLGIFEK